jgi:hypothetical protein
MEPACQELKVFISLPANIIVGLGMLENSGETDY